jgi:hypothetical protein
MPYCSNCGKEASQSDKFSKFCGVNLIPPESQSAKTQAATSSGADEHIVGVVPHLVQAGQGIASKQWTLVATNQRILLAQMGPPQIQEALALSKARAKGLSKLIAGKILTPVDLVEFSRRYFSMSPGQILAETQNNLSFKLASIRKAWVDYELDPKDDESHIRMDRYKLVFSVSERGEFTFVFDADPQDVTVLRSVLGERVEGDGRRKPIKPTF